MFTKIDPALWGWVVTGVMLTSGYALGSLADRLLRLIGIRDKGTR